MSSLVQISLDPTELKHYRLDVVRNLGFLVGAKVRGVLKLNKFVRETVLTECENPKIVLVGNSLGAWVINEWLNFNKDLWGYISAVELYGDTLWHRFGPASLGDPPETYKGLARHAGIFYAYDNNPQGPGGELSTRWQSRCLVRDPVCGEGYVGLDALIDQINDAVHCNDNRCEHQKYTQANGGYNLTERGAKFLALKTFPEVFTTDHPRVAHYETFVEGVHVYFRLYYTDPHNEVNGFGFVGIKGSGWAEENRLFSDYPWARVVPIDKSGIGRVDHPFNHLCGEPGEYASDIEAWVLVLNPDGSIRDGSPGVDIHLTCSAPKEVVTPFFPN
jgi:hypothetical protein